MQVTKKACSSTLNAMHRLVTTSQKYKLPNWTWLIFFIFSRLTWHAIPFTGNKDNKDKWKINKGRSILFLNSQKEYSKNAYKIEDRSLLKPFC